MRSTTEALSRFWSTLMKLQFRKMNPNLKFSNKMSLKTILNMSTCTTRCKIITSIKRQCISFTWKMVTNGVSPRILSYLRSTRVTNNLLSTSYMQLGISSRIINKVSSKIGSNSRTTVANPINRTTVVSSRANKTTARAITSSVLLLCKLRILSRRWIKFLLKINSVFKLWKSKSKRNTVTRSKSRTSWSS